MEICIIKQHISSIGQEAIEGNKERRYYQLYRFISR